MAKKEEKERTNEMKLFDGCFANFYFFLRLHVYTSLYSVRLAYNVACAHTV